MSRPTRPSEPKTQLDYYQDTITRTFFWGVSAAAGVWMYNDVYGKQKATITAAHSEKNPAPTAELTAAKGLSIFCGLSTAMAMYVFAKTVASIDGLSKYSTPVIKLALLMKERDDMLQQGARWLFGDNKPPQSPIAPQASKPLSGNDRQRLN